MKRSVYYMLLCAILVLSLLCGCTAENVSENAKDAESSDNSNAPYAQGEIVAATPDETGARVAQISGFSADRDVCEMSLPYTVKDTSLQVIAVGRYSGGFFEDGTDEPVENVASVVVQNTGDKLIKNATVLLIGADNREYTFAVTTLPSGRSALLLEANRAEFAEEEKISLASAVVEEMDAAEFHKDKFEMTFSDGKFSLKNLTEKDFRAVYIRYKNFSSGNVYMGGVTYSASFSNVSAFGEYQCEPTHYFEEYSEILMIQIVE